MDTRRLLLPIGLIVLVGGIVVYQYSVQKNTTVNSQLSQDTSSQYRHARLHFPNGALQVEVADTHRLRVQGLSGHAPLLKDQGMLFVFDTDDFHGIWMKDMNFPIDIIWLSSERKVIHIEHTVDPSTYPSTFTPPSVARYVIETPAQWAREHEVTLGDEVLIAFTE